MKIVLFSRSRVNHNLDDLRLIITEIELRGYQYSVNGEFAEILHSQLNFQLPSHQIYWDDIGEQPDDSVMVCYGGDGTLLEGVHRSCGRKIVVVGINSGRLGFLTCVSRNGISELFDSIESGSLRVEKRAMIAVRGEFTRGEWLNAVNEFTVLRQGASMVAVETLVGGQAVATYHGDGVIVSTPTGSTAYSMSAGGPLVSPECGCWVVAPLAPHNITMRPMILPDSCHMLLRVKMREGDAAVSIDNMTFPIANGAELELRRADCYFYLGLNSNISFYQTLRNKMMWGVDSRD